jgi:dipeptidyl aminopeptidase/acylaminoacyl peptidase
MYDSLVTRPLYTLILVCLVSTPVAAQSRWSADDTQRFQQIHDVQISPDGRTLALEISRPDLAGNHTSTVVAVVPADGHGALRILTAAGTNDESPRWSPDGRRLALLSTANDRTALVTLAADGTQRRHVVDIESASQQFGEFEDGDAFAWAPDGKSFVFTAADPATPAIATDPLVITRFMYQAYTDFSDARRTQLFLVSADGGTPRKLSDGTAVDLAPAWSPSGKEIVFVSNREADPDFRRHDDLWVADVATGHVRQLTHGIGSSVRPVWSPDGASIAYLGTKRKWATYDSMAEDFHAWIIAATGGEPREINGELDRRTVSVAWKSDSKTVVFTAEDQGRVLPYSVPSSGGVSTPMFARDVQISDPSLASNGRLAFAMTGTTAPIEAAVFDTDAPRVVTQINSTTLPARDAVTVWVKTTENTMVQGWLILPAEANASHRVPLLLSIHGGPHGAFGYRFTPEYQLYASRGYAVLYLNPRGSSAYGQQFSDACIGNWGGVDYTDLMMGVDYVLATHPEIDPDRMFVTGGSYGGYMTNWVVTHTGRFRAAVTREGMSNLTTDAALSDAWDLEVIEFGPPAENYETYLRWSPIRYVDRTETPTMIIHGLRDHDVTFAEAGQMYAGLRMHGVESQLVLYPREPHGFHEPKHIVDAYDRMWRWFEAHRTGDRHMDQHWDADRGARQWEGTIPITGHAATP